MSAKGKLTILFYFKIKQKNAMVKFKQVNNIVKIEVNSFPDYKVQVHFLLTKYQIVNSFPDLKVQVNY